MKTQVYFIVVGDIIFAIKALLCNTEYFYAVDSDV
jgi:hypothetical protein